LKRGHVAVDVSDDGEAHDLRRLALARSAT
jgi:hypothetical protein